MLNELAYRKKQRQLGEAQVALSLLADLLKSRPGSIDFEIAVEKAWKIKHLLTHEVFAMERENESHK